MLTTKEKTSSLARKQALKQIWGDRYLYAMLLPALAVVFFFSYVPMWGIIMSFQDFSIFKGVFDSKWVGLANFQKILSQKQFLGSIWNTLACSLLGLAINFWAPIILALLLNELEHKIFKRVSQTISYLPHFLSWMSVIGIVHIMFGRDGLINDALVAFGAEDRITFLAQQNYFIWFVVFISLWKEVGWGTIIHLANLSSVNQELYEAAKIDGANRVQQLWYITLPHMVPTIVILLIFQMGSIFGSNFELIYGLQNPFIDFEVISTIIYRSGIQNGNYSLATALGFLQGLVALVLVLITNWFAKKTTGTGIW